MPQPQISSVHVNRPLTNMSVAYLQDAKNFVAQRAFPRVTSPNKSNVYYTYPKAYWLTSQAQKRAAGAESAGSGYTLSTTTFNCERDAIHKDIDDPTRQNADQPLDLDREASLWGTQQLMLKMETAWATAYFATSIWDNSGSQGGGAWELAASTPIEDIRTAKRTVLGNTGFVPNTLILGAKCFDNLIDHPDILDRIKYTGTNRNPAQVDETALAELFGIERVMVCRAVQNTVTEAKTPSYGFIAGTRHALLLYSAPSPGLYTPSGGYTFVWNGVPGGDNAFGMRIKSFRIERLESTRVEAEWWYNFGVVAADLGVFWNNAVAA